MKMKHNNKGFSLVELIVVIAIMAILGGVGTAGYTKYIEQTNKKADMTLVGNVVRALETSAYSQYADFTLGSQYSQGLEIPVGFVVLSNDTITTKDANDTTVSGTMIALSNDTSKDPLNTSLIASMGEDFSTTTKLKYDGWKVDSLGDSNFHKASAGMINKIDDVGNLMSKVGNLGITMTVGTYDDSGDMIISVSQRIADYDKDGIIEQEDKTKFISAWTSVTNEDPGSVGFGLDGREYYSAVRMAYNNAFAEYVRANYDGEQDTNTLANNISNYGESAGELVTEKVKDTSIYKTTWNTAYTTAYYNFLSSTYKNSEKSSQAADSYCESIITTAVDSVANTETKFPWTATSKAFEDTKFAGYNDSKCESLYAEWIGGQDEKDASIFYDMMLTCATDGAAYAETYGNDKFVEWFEAQAQAYSKNFENVETLVKGKSAIVITVYYKDGIVNCKVDSSEADPRD